MIHKHIPRRKCLLNQRGPFISISPIRGGPLISISPIRGGPLISISPIRGGPLISISLIRGGPLISISLIRGGPLIPIEDRIMITRRLDLVLILNVEEEEYFQAIWLPRMRWSVAILICIYIRCFFERWIKIKFWLVDNFVAQWGSVWREWCGHFWRVEWGQFVPY